MQELLQVAFVVIKKTVNSTVLDTYYWALDSMPYCVRLYSLDGKKIYVNKCTAFVGESVMHKRKSFDAGKESIVQGEANNTSVVERLEQGQTAVCFGKNGRSYRQELAYVLDPLGKKAGIIEFVRPLDNLADKNIKRWKNMLKARYDSLTRLYNHDSFVEVTHKFLKRNFKEKYVLGIWDVRHFKMINTSFGIEVGDKVLQRIGDIIKLLVQDQGVACRLIGDKFGFCLPETMLTEKWLRKNTEIMLVNGRGTYKFETQFGLCHIQNNGERIHTLLDRCMMALRSNSQTNCDAFTWYTPEMAAKLNEEQELLRDADIAFNEGQFVPYLQPIYSVATGKIIAAEALARWIHPQKGLIPPDKFIPLFERHGMIFRLDLCIWSQVGAMLAEQREMGEHCVPISINVSRVDFLNPFLVEELDKLIKKNNLRPEQLRIEVTESAYAEEPKKIIKLVSVLREKGFGILLDDFGSGYSSLNVLKDIPVDILKIDMKFMDEFEKVERAGNIVANIVRMAHEIDLKVVAEGVETEEQARFLREMGCEFIQGYFYAKPQTQKDFLALLQSGRRCSLSYATNEQMGEDFKKSAFIRDVSKQDGIIFRHYMGASAFYKIADNQFGLLRGNEEYYHLINPDDAASEQGPIDILGIFPKTESLKVLEICEKSRATRSPLQCVVKQSLKDRERRLLLEINYIVDIRNQAIYFIHFVDLEKVLQQ